MEPPSQRRCVLLIEHDLEHVFIVERAAGGLEASQRLNSGSLGPSVILDTIRELASPAVP